MVSEEVLFGLRVSKITFYSCYLTPNERIQDFQSKLNALEEEILSTRGCVVVAGDFNSKSLEWGMPYPDTQGRLVLEMAARTGLLVVNVGNTFRRPGYNKTIPNVSFSSESLVSRIKHWRVNEEYSDTDHLYISFEV